MCIVKASGRFAVNWTALWVTACPQLSVGVIDKKQCYGQGSIKESDMQLWLCYFGVLSLFYIHLYFSVTSMT